jgi:hypothetical protein
VGMSTAFDSSLRDLPPNERAEVERILAERSPANWVSDEVEELSVYMLLALVNLIVIVSCLLVYSPAELVGYWSTVSGKLPDALLSPIPAFWIAAATLPLHAIRYLVLHNRHGWMATSFGLVRVRGSRLQIARWSELIRLEMQRYGTGNHRYITITAQTHRGVLECNSGALWEAIKERASTGPVAA